MKSIKRIGKEFKDFAIQGNAITLAVGVLIGTAFKTVMDSLVKDILLPPINFLTQKVDFSNLYLILGRRSYSTIEEAETAGAIIIRYGNFITELIVFLITAVAVFIFVYKFQQILKRKARSEKKAKPRCQYCRVGISAKATRCPHCTSKSPIKKG